ncbi:MAG: hypothetical protein KDC80_19035 [Saprospiraceae bacterium]|nr:hypothetical protein [Saprospiraceae bacterium]
MSATKYDWETMTGLLEIAKTGNLPDLLTLRNWLHAAGLSESGQPEADYYRLLSTYLTINKGASMPENVIPDQVSPPEKEDLPFASIEVVPFLKESLIFKDWTLLEEILRLLVSQKKLVPPTALPLLLDRGKDLIHLHRFMLLTMGKRATWLAAQRDQWQWYIDMQSPDLTVIHSENQLYWLKAHLHTDMEEVQKSITKFSKNVRESLLQYIFETPRTHHEPIARYFAKSPTQKEKYLAQLILLKLPTAERNAAQEDLKKLFIENLELKKGEITFKIPEYQSDLFDSKLTKKIFGSDLFSALAIFFPPDLYCAHLGLEKKEIIRQLMADENLRSLYQLFLDGAANFTKDSTWGELLILEWIELYPEGNTTEVSLIHLLEKLTYASVQKVLRSALHKDNQFFMEKMTILTSGIEHYLKKDLSEALIQRIFQHIDHRLSRTDTNNLILALPHLQYLADPRSYHTLVSQWREVDGYQQKLEEALWDFRNIMQQRQKILNTIIN